MKNTKELITKSTAEHILLWCTLKYGSSIWNETGLIKLKIRSSINYWGKYYAEDNNMCVIFVNLKFHTTLKELIDTVIHEYIHHKQPLFYKYNEYFDLGYTIKNHPFEIEAAQIASRDSNECKKWLLKRL